MDNFLEQIKELNTPEKLSAYMKTHIRYGYIRRDINRVETNDFKDFYLKYSLMSPKEVYDSCVGICWDQTLFEKYVFDNVIKRYDYKIFFLQQENVNESTHTFLAFTKNGKYYYFENAFEEYAGIKEFNSYDDIILFVANNMRKSEGPDNGIYVNELGKEYPKINSTCKEFYTFCINKKEIALIESTNIFLDEKKVYKTPYTMHKWVYTGTYKKFDTYIEAKENYSTYISAYRKIACAHIYNKNKLKDHFDINAKGIKYKYDVYDEEDESLQDIADSVTITVTGVPKFKKFQFEQTGYIYRIPVDKSDVRRYKWMVPKKEGIIHKEKIKFDDVQKVTVTFHVVWGGEKSLTEDTEILSEASSSLTPAEIKECKRLIYGTFDRLDPSGINTKLYKDKLEKMSNVEFEKYFKEFCSDPDLNFKWRIQPYKNDMVMENIVEAAKFLNVPLFEYVYMPFLGSAEGTNDLYKTRFKVPVGYIHEKRMQQMLSKKNSMSIHTETRSATTGQVTGHDKNSRVSDAENIALTTLDSPELILEFLSAKSDDMYMKTEMLKQIKNDGYVDLSKIKSTPKNKVAINTLDVYFTSLAIKTNLITDGLLLTKTLNNQNKDASIISKNYRRD